MTSKRKKADTELGTRILRNMARVIEREREKRGLNKKEMAELIAEHTGQSVAQIEADSDRDRWFTAAQALEYGFIDHVYERAAQLPGSDAPNQ